MAFRSNQEIFNDIMSRPSAPFIVEKASRALEAERQRREQFYNDSKYEHAEFINGEVVIHSPVTKEHNDVSGNLFVLMDTYVQKHRLGYVGFLSVMITLSRNDYEPDICFFGQEKSQHFVEGQSLFPAPDLVVEVLSKKTAANDRGIKFEDYRAHGVREYWLIDPIARSVEQYRLDAEQQYVLILKSGNGLIHSEALPDFHLRIEAMFDAGVNLEELGRILVD